MKRFKELNKEQREEAIDNAMQTLVTEMRNSGLEFDRKADGYLLELATFLAEDTHYSEKTDRIIEGIVE